MACQSKKTQIQAKLTCTHRHHHRQFHTCSVHSTPPPLPSTGTTSYQPCRLPPDRLRCLLPWQLMQETVRRRCGSMRQHGPSPPCPATLVPPSRFYATLYASFSLPDKFDGLPILIRILPPPDRGRSAAAMLPANVSIVLGVDCAAVQPALPVLLLLLRAWPARRTQSMRLFAFHDIADTFILLHRTIRFQKLTFCSCLCACSRHHVRSCRSFSSVV